MRFLAARYRTRSSSQETQQHEAPLLDAPPLAEAAPGFGRSSRLTGRLPAIIATDLFVPARRLAAALSNVHDDIPATAGADPGENLLRRPLPDLGRRDTREGDHHHRSAVPYRHRSNRPTVLGSPQRRSASTAISSPLSAVTWAADRRARLIRRATRALHDFLHRRGKALKPAS